MKRINKVVLIAFVLAISLNFINIASAETDQTKDVNVPLRIICEAEGAKITCNPQNISVSKGTNLLTVKVGSTEVSINGKTVTLESKIQVVNNRVMVPMSLINKAFGMNLTTEDIIKAIAVKYMDLIRQGNISDCSMLYSSYLCQDITPDLVKALGTGLSSFGELKLGSVEFDKNALHESVILSYNSVLIGPFKYIIRFDSKLQIDDFMMDIVPTVPYMAPGYDDSTKYTEKAVIIGDGKWKLPGILTMPKGDGPFPVVVLVHGSGANDMDESVGALKPFRDIAVGLASKNIAVLRYNKRTFEHNASVGVTNKFTVKEETVDDAITAVNYLNTVQGIDKSRIFVIGHSQGAMLMPKIIKADKTGAIKGAVMMSGNSRPLQDVIIDQYQYFYKLNQMTKAQLDFYVSQYSMINDPSFSADNPPKGYALGNKYWWADLKTYNQIEAAKDITTPLLIMQGARDYQVSAEKDFQGWKDALSDKSNVTFKLYPKLNHMYTEGEGEMSTNLEYYNPANIPSYVIDDISQWIGSVK